MKETKKFIYLFCYRIFFMIIALFLISKLTGLGDYERYMRADFVSVLNKNKMNILLKSTPFMDFLIGFMRRILLNNRIIINLLLNFMTTYGIFLFIKATKYNKIVVIILLFPSFTIWSSYASKESFAVFSSAVIMSTLINIKNKIPINRREKILFLISLYLMFIFKKQYIPSLVIVYLYLKNKMKMTVLTKQILLILTILGIASTLYIFRENIESISKGFHRHFRETGGSTRSWNLFQERYGFFKNLFYGMFISVWGPGFKELSGGILSKFSFVESAIIVLSLITLGIKKIQQQKMSSFLILIISIFLLLIVQYPFGVFNAGSAIRYRTNLYVILIGYIYIFRENINIKKFRRRVKKNNENITNYNQPN